MTILVFAGTTDGSVFIRLASEAGHQVTASVTSDYGRESLVAELGALAERVNIIEGRMTQEAMQIYMRRNSYELVIDATHPYAGEATRNIVRACSNMEVPFFRLVRKASAANDGSILGLTYVDSVAQAIEHLNTTNYPFFLSTGSSSIEEFATVKNAETRLFVRIIPSIESIQICRKAGVPSARIIAMQGPFSQEMNESMFRATNAKILVTKDGGSPGGFEEKVAAAKKCGMGIIVISRPKEDIPPEYCFSIAELTAHFDIKPAKRVVLASGGMGTEGSLSVAVNAALRSAPLVLGSRRMLDTSAGGFGGEKKEAVKPQEILDALEGWYDSKGILCPPDAAPVVLFSGDAGFFSGAQGALAVLEKEGWQCRIEPGVSTPAAFSAKIGIPWHDWRLVSAHGRPADLAQELAFCGKTFFLCDEKTTPLSIAEFLCQQGAGQTKMYIGLNLYSGSEKIIRTWAEKLADSGLSPQGLCVVLVDSFDKQRMPSLCQSAFTFGDGFFERARYADGSPIPMTKECVRHAALQMLSLGASDVFFDIGAGTGSVAVEAAAVCCCSVFAIERDAEACKLVSLNKDKASVWNLRVVEGSAPEVFARKLDGIRPTAAFIGGSGGQFRPIVSALAELNPQVRIVAAAITMETLCAAVSCAKELGRAAKVSQISVSAPRPAGDRTMLAPQTPVFLVEI